MFRLFFRDPSLSFDAVHVGSGGEDGDGVDPGAVFGLGGAVFVGDGGVGDFIDDGEAVEDLAEDGVGAVEGFGLAVDDEELSAGGIDVEAGAGHGEDAADVGAGGEFGGLVEAGAAAAAQ